MRVAMKDPIFKFKKTMTGDEETITINITLSISAISVVFGMSLLAILLTSIFTSNSCQSTTNGAIIVKQTEAM
jgi:hypothetical protein